MDQRQLEDYNKVIESLGIKYIKASNIKLAKPVTISDFHDPENTILVVKKGEVKFGEKNELVSICFRVSSAFLYDFGPSVFFGTGRVGIFLLSSANFL